LLHSRRISFLPIGPTLYHTESSALGLTTRSYR